tara:strand:+ start:102 stop:1151 length:1050 start_codon:yes stop_codon:yes gene_type:complete
MYKPDNKLDKSKALNRNLFESLGNYIKSIQLESGAIPSNKDGSHDPWDHIESIMGLNFVNEKESSKLAFEWLIKNQNTDGSWFSKYNDNHPIEKNKSTHFGPYISVAALHFYKVFEDKEFLEYLWPNIKLALKFSLSLQIPNGTIPWSVDENGQIEEDYLLTGSSSILKSIECGIAISKLLNDQENITNWTKSYESLSNAIKDPIGKFDLLQDRKRFSMDWYYPILSGCLNDKEKNYYIERVFNDFYIKDIGIKCVTEEPWITVAETCEFIIALMISGRGEDAKKLLLDILNICDENYIPYMGWQYEENIFWPKEKPSWTSAAAILAADTVLDFSKASDLFKRDQLSLY